MPTSAVKQNLTNHIFLVLDASYSMQHLQEKVIKVTDELISSWAKDSVEKEQETRVSVYTFADTSRCDIWDMDVMRLPSMSGVYSVRGNTALIDATCLALDDSDLITEKYSDHAFLIVVLTDGQENASRGTGVRPAYGRLPRDVLASQMAERFRGLKDNRTVAVLVPNDQDYAEAKRYGFENIALWDATTEAGLQKAVEEIKVATRTYMDNRAKGVRSTKALFVGAEVDADAIKAAKLTPLPTSDRKIVVVARSRALQDIFFEKPINRPTKSRPVADKAWHVEIKPYVDAAYPPYRVGMGYYELTKSEKVTGDKQIAVVEVNTNQVYVGAGARQLLGLPQGVCRVKPTLNPDYKIFVESTSLNRHLREGTQVLLLTK